MTNINDFKAVVQNSSLGGTQKEALITAIDNIVASPNKRISVIKDGDYIEYLTLRNDDLGALSFCIAKKEGIDSSTITKFDFINIREAYSYMVKHNIDFNPDKVEATSNIISNYIEIINKHRNSTQAEKSTVIKVLDTLKNSQTNKAFLRRTDEYQEYLTIKNNSLYLVECMTDYAGTVLHKNQAIISPIELLELLTEKDDELKYNGSLNI